MSDQRRLERMYWHERDAGTVADLVAAGVNLDTPLWDDRPNSLLRNVMRHPTFGCRPLTLANELLASGASAAFWMAPDDFQREVLTVLFDAGQWTGMEHFELRDDRRFDLERDGGLIVDFMAGLLAQGLDANMTVRLCVMKLSGSGHGADFRYARLRWHGPLLGAIALLLCGRGTLLRSLCAPLAELLLRHGASPQAEGELVKSTDGETYCNIHLQGDWSREAWESQALTGSVLDCLLQRQAQAPDEVDAAVIAMMAR